jgi:unsaturated rhamnogalacturonyl hydrolase
MKKILLGSFLLAAGIANAQSYGEQMAATVMKTWKDSVTAEEKEKLKWNYDQGVILQGIEGLWYKTSNPRYFQYIQNCMDNMIDDAGNIRTYKQEDYNIDNILCGRALLTLYKVTEKPKYYKAALNLRKQLQTHPRTKAGGFWHKKRYPYQMWLDGLYMGEPFYTEWAATFNEDTAFNDIAKQFILMERFSRDAKTGLMYHGYDESREQKWADKTTGLSPNFWARAMGWYGIALVDVLEDFPDAHPKKDSLVQILNRFAAAVQKVQDSKTGLWWDILNYPNREKNYLEASASSMFVYALAKGARLGYLPASYATTAKKGYDGIIKNFIATENGMTVLKGTVSVSGLGGDPGKYRDGSYEYYMSEKVITNDPKGIGAFLQASNEIELLPTLGYGKGKTVLLDNYFNNEYKKDITGATIPFHYIWSEMDNNGFSLLKYLFNSYGVKTATLHEAPTAATLAQASIYLVVDPDSKKETANPNYIQQKDIDVLYKWVSNGGVLVLMANDSTNVEFKHFNQLTQKFGIRLSDSSRNMVKGNNYETGAVHIPANHSIFKTVSKVYLKEICLLGLTPPAKAAVTEDGDAIMATAKVGKGTVFLVSDPWLYNEYTDGRKIPAEYQNAGAARDLIQWLIKQSK